MLRSTCSAQASTPPARLITLSKPARSRKYATCMLRAPWWQMQTMARSSGNSGCRIGTLAIGSTVVTFVTFLNGLAVLGPVRTAIISTIEPFYTAILGAIVLDQRLGPGTAIGGVLIGGAVLLLQRQPTSP